MNEKSIEKSIEVVEAYVGWDHVQHIKDPNGIVHGWDVYIEETGELRTDCGLVFWAGDQSPDWLDTQKPCTCSTCDRIEQAKAAEGRA